MDTGDDSGSGTATASRVALGSPRHHLLDEPLCYVRARAADVRAFVVAGLVAGLVTAALFGWIVALSVTAFGETVDPGPAADVAGVSLLVWTGGSSLMLLTFLIASWQQWSGEGGGRPRSVLREALARLVPMTASYLLAALALVVTGVVAVSPVLVTVLADRSIGPLSVAASVVSLLLAGRLFVTRLYPLLLLPFAVMAGTRLRTAPALLRQPAPGEAGMAVAGCLAVALALLAAGGTAATVLFGLPLVGPVLWLAVLSLGLGYPVVVLGSLYSRLGRLAGVGE